MKKVYSLVLILCAQSMPLQGMDLIKKALCCCCCCHRTRIVPDEQSPLSPEVVVHQAPTLTIAAQKPRPPQNDRTPPAKIKIPDRAQEEGSLTPQNSPQEQRVPTPRPSSDSAWECNMHRYLALKRSTSALRKHEEIGNCMILANNLLAKKISAQTSSATPSQPRYDHDFFDLDAQTYNALFSDTDFPLDDTPDEDDQQSIARDPAVIPLRTAKKCPLSTFELMRRINRTEGKLYQFSDAARKHKEELKDEYRQKLIQLHLLKKENNCTAEQMCEKMTPVQENKKITNKYAGDAS